MKFLKHLLQITVAYAADQQKQLWRCTALSEQDPFILI